MASSDLNFASVTQSAVLPGSSTYVPGMAIAAGSSFSTGVFFNPQQAAIAAGANLSVAGTLSIQRYVDQAGLIPQGAPTTLALAAGVASSVTVGDGLPYLSYTVMVTPSGGAAATLTTLAITLRAREVVGGTTGNPFSVTLGSAGLGTQVNPLVEKDVGYGTDLQMTVRDITSIERIDLLVAQQRVMLDQLILLNNSTDDADALIGAALARVSNAANPYV